VEVLFQRGAFDAATAALTAEALAAYAIGLPAFVLLKVLAPGFFARGDTAMPVRIGLASIALNLSLNVVLMGPMQHMGPPLASSVSNWANVIGLAAVLAWRGHMAIDRALLIAIARMLAACAAMAAALWLLERAAYAPLRAEALLRWLGLAALVGGGLAAYGAAAFGVGLVRLRDLRALRRWKD